MQQKRKFSNVAEYISLYPPEIQKGLKLLRKTIKEAAPAAEETISYNMPAYKLNGMLVFFAAMKNHFGFYPTPGVMKPFQEKLKEYETSKGAIRFPLDKPIPVKLVREIVKWKVRDNLKDNLLKEKIKK
jgi:uncharacterized protein YdhG (YjbR/CyaY superfamily)